MISLQLKERCIAETKVERQIQIHRIPSQYNKAHIDINSKLSLVCQ